MGVSALKKYLCYILSVLLMLSLALGLTAAVSADTAYVHDNAGLIDSQQEAQLEQTIAKLRKTYKQDFVAVVEMGTGSKTAQQYADDYYDQKGFGYGKDSSGILLLIDMENRQIALSTYGSSIRYFTDKRINLILDKVAAALQKGTVADGVQSFLDEAAYYCKEGIPKGQHTVDSETGAISRYHSVSGKQLLLFAVISLGAAGFICAIVLAKYSMRTNSYYYPYSQKGTMNLTRREDTYINTTVTTRRIEQSSSSSSSHHSSSSRSTTHRSSSGRSHGGGSRGF